MPHIHTEPGQHDHTASAYIFRIDSKEPKLLLHRHKKLNTYQQFGGHIELDETPWRTMEHELVEETGYELAQLEILQPKKRLKKLSFGTLHPQVAVHNTHEVREHHFHTDLGYVFVTSEEPKHRISEGESQDIIMVTRTELQDMTDTELSPGVKDIGLYIFGEVLLEWERVSTNEFK